jgi:hypothetical protein
MVGERNGVGAILKRKGFPLLIQIHCTAHRLALAVSQSAHKIPHISQFEDYVNNVYAFSPSPSAL